MPSKTDRSSKLWCTALGCALLLLATALANAQTTSTIKCVQVASGTLWSPTARAAVPYPRVQTAGNLNIIVVGWNDTSATARSVVDSRGNTYALAVGPTKGTALTQSIYYATNILGGSNTVTVNFSQAAAYADIRVLEFAGLSAARLDVTAGARGTSGNNAAVSSGVATTTSARELIFGAGTTSLVFTKAGSLFTADVITTFGDIAEYEDVSASGTYGATAILGNTGLANWVMQMATFKSATAATAPPPAPPPAPNQHTVTLTWKASTSANVIRYNVYRSTISGGYYGLVGSAPGSLSYADRTVDSGTTYYYVTTAVNEQGEESTHSNQVVIVVPSP